MTLADQVYRFKCRIVYTAWLDNGCCTTRAARALGIHRNTFMTWLKRARGDGR